MTSHLMHSNVLILYQASYERIVAEDLCKFIPEFSSLEDVCEDCVKESFIGQLDLIYVRYYFSIFRQRSYIKSSILNMLQSSTNCAWWKTMLRLIGYPNNGSKVSFELHHINMTLICVPE